MVDLRLTHTTCHICYLLRWLPWFRLLGCGVLEYSESYEWITLLRVSFIHAIFRAARLFPVDPFTADSKWQLDAGGVHRTPFGQLENYDVFSADHTSQYGFSMGHPLRGFDLTEDTERGGVKAIARHRLSTSDNMTWSRPSNICLCSCFRGSIRSVQVSFR